MYCQYCGTEATNELNYCKRCGGNLNPPMSAPVESFARPSISPMAVWGMGASTFGIVFGGLIVLFGFISEMMRTGNLHGAVYVWMAALGALIIVGSVGLLVWLWLSLLGGRTRHETSSSPQLRRPSASTADFITAPPRVSALPEPVPSVTEHTTRTFEPSYRDTK
jgi:hypothetical protein